jgi:hypothetical protein
VVLRVVENPATLGLVVWELMPIEKLQVFCVNNTWWLLVGKRLDSNFGKSDEKRHGIPAPASYPASILDA